jgi:hypothetical protein
MWLQVMQVPGRPPDNDPNLLIPLLVGVLVLGALYGGYRWYKHSYERDLERARDERDRR